MIARMRRSLREDEGFTLVELLVVIIIIGILSAVAVPVYLNQQKKAKDSAANSDVSTLGKEIQAALVDNTDGVGTITITGGTRYTLKLTSADTGTDVGRISNGVVLVDASGKETDSVSLSTLDGSTDAISSTNWCIGVAASDGSKKLYRYSAKNGIESGKSCDGTSVFTKK